MTPYEALYGRSCRSSICWTRMGERSIIGLDLIRDTSEKVDLIRKVPSYGSEQTKELHRQTASTSRVRGR